VLLTSVEELSQQARNLSSRELLTLCRILDEVLPEVREHIGLPEHGSSQEVAFQCRRAAKELVAELQRQSFDAERLAGYIEQGSKDWLEHEVALVRLATHWLTLDLTAAQIPWFQDKSMVILLCEPDWVNLEAELRHFYLWWVPDR
jgi:hypothetical protein